MKKIIILLSVCFPLCCSAQMSGQLGAYEYLPQRVLANPALRPGAKLNIAFPALGNLYIEHGNNWLRPAASIDTDSRGRSVFNSETVLANIGEAAVTRQGLSIELMHVGIRIDKNYFHVGVRERMSARLVLPRDLFNLAIYGNAGSHEFENNTADFSGLALDAIHYREYTAGYSREINDEFSVGVTLKYLYGMERIHTEESSLKLHTDANTYALQSSGELIIKSSGIDDLLSDGEGGSTGFSEYAFKRGNTGFGADIGGVWRPIPKLEVQLSAHDIGFIRWKYDIANYGGGRAGFLYDGLDLSEFLFDEEADFNDRIDEEADRLLEELEEVYGFEKTEEEFTTSLNGYLRYGAAYELMKTDKSKGTVWANAFHGIGKSTVPFRVSVGYQQQLWRSIQAGLHLTKQSKNPIGLGGGLALNAGFFQIYSLVENISFARLTRVKYTSDGNSDEFVLPENSGDIRVHFGINFTFGRKDQGTAPPMLKAN